MSEYVVGTIYGAGFFVHAGTVLGILLAAELAILSVTVRGSAWVARRAALNDLHVALFGKRLAFGPERRLLDEAARLTQEIDALYSEVAAVRD